MKEFYNIKIIYKNINEAIINQVYNIHKEKLGEGHLSFEHFKTLAEK